MFFPSAARKFPGRKKFLLLPGNFWAAEGKKLISFSFPSAKRCPNQLVLINCFFQHIYAILDSVFSSSDTKHDLLKFMICISL